MTVTTWLYGLRTRPARSVLAASILAVGAAAIVAAAGLGASARAERDRLRSPGGADLLAVVAGPGTPLPAESIAMIGRIRQVRSVTATAVLPGVRVHRTDRAGPTAVGVLAARPEVAGTLGATVRSGTWFNPATARFPTVVLGAAAARQLGLSQATPQTQIWLGRRWFAVLGILDPVPLAPELDTAALVGWPVAASQLGFDGRPTTVYGRSLAGEVDQVRALLPRTADPRHPGQVSVIRPADALAARGTVPPAHRGLLLGFGALALLTGTAGVATTMAVAVLERRGEIGLRKALGATEAHVRGQFLAEAVLLGLLGGAGGALLGAAATAGYATARGWPVAVPALAVAGALLATAILGAAAGRVPADRAARVAPGPALAHGPLLALRSGGEREQ